ncbi:transcriptional regulator CynR [Duganella sp. BJB488]|uniref:transcriptional regulator CynR n=1 Tax=unclassified Duganella TaxID=2636909 RepID=UPI000E352594|nr:MULTISPECIES: transcriptional regulator CynR [unclassified Duganella]RFP24437.1 transcriptional regulator CynR [Duganella sp. BJB489]RFP26798.1 transcriptional regulator CynR [Duganella sp. BJB488]RFP34470.1 transcriptional regulator CynR [Duganella sp. BJB480]
MQLRHIRYLLAVVEHQNFTRAAEVLHVSQPTLSQQIRQLEDTLGAQLLDRSGRTVRPTDAGTAYIEYARRALRELQAGQRAIHDVRDLSRGALRLAMTPTFTAYLVGPAIERFNARYPGIAINIREMALDAIESALAEDEVDLAIAFSAVRSAELDCRALFVEQLSVVVGAGHPFAARADGIAPADLAAAPLALLTADFATRVHVDAYFQAQGMRPRIAVEANTISGIVEIVRRGSIATILPDAIAREHEGLRAIALTPAFAHRGVALLSRKGAYQSAAANAFAELLAAMVAL